MAGTFADPIIIDDEEGTESNPIIIDAPENVQELPFMDFRPYLSVFPEWHVHPYPYHTRSDWMPLPIDRGFFDRRESDLRFAAYVMRQAKKGYYNGH